MAATLKVTNDTLKISALDRSTASMSHIRHYQVVPWETGPLILLESIAKVQIGKSLKRNLTIQTRKNSINHWVLYPVLTVILELELFFSDSQALRC